MNRLKHSILSTEQITKYERTVRSCKPIWLATRQRLSANIRSAQQTASAADSNITTCSSSIAARGPTSLLFTVGTGGPFPGESGWGMQLATHLHLVPALSMRGAIPPLPLYVSMASTNFPMRDVRLPPRRNEKCALLGYHAESGGGNFLPTPVRSCTTLCVITHKCAVISFTFTSALSGHRITIIPSRQTLNG